MSQAYYDLPVWSDSENYKNVITLDKEGNA